jgi:hypothetical protein
MALHRATLSGGMLGDRGANMSKQLGNPAFVSSFSLWKHIQVCSGAFSLYKVDID